MPFADERFSERIAVVPAAAEWAAEAAAYADLLREALPDALAVDHIGSTSVPGLAAKDCLDLMVQVAQLHEGAVTAALAARGFRVRPESWNREEVTEGVTHRKLVFAGPVGGRTVNVHVRLAGGRNVRYALLFGAFLRADDDARRAWGDFKIRLAQSVTDLMEYGQIKAGVQPLLMRIAERWAAETGWRVPAAASYAGPPVLGVDGCRAGWVGALLDGTTYDVLIAAHLATLVTAAREVAPELATVAVDMPIGLAEDGPRTTDVLARSRLPVGRKSSVFPAPARAAAEQPTYAEANAANKEALGKGLSQQAFRLLPKIREVEAYLRSGPPVTVLEAHPEVSFAEIDPACVVPSKTTPGGAAARRVALTGLGLRPPAYLSGRGYAADDLLDACVVAWSARRYADGTAYPLPDPPEVLSDGIPAAIWV